LILAYKGVEETPSEGAEVVGVFELIELGRITSELLVKPSNGKCILLATAHKLIFFGSLQSHCSFERSNRQADYQYRQGEQYREQPIPALPFFPQLGMALLHDF